MTPYVIIFASAVALLNRYVIANEWRLSENTTVSLASVTEGRFALRRRDGFIQRLSPLDRSVRLKTERDVTEQQFLDHAAGQVLSWTSEEAETIDAVVASIRETLAPWNLPLPARVLLVKTSGREENGAAYCRGKCVVLSRRVINMSSERLEKLLIHELFHVLSGHNPELRRELYAVVGFKTCPEIEIPPALRSRKLTNPDAPEMNSYVQLMYQGQMVKMVPILYGNHDRYDAQNGLGLFQIMNFKLMIVESKDGIWRALERDGEPVLVDVKEVPSFYDRVGRNTDYILHPEETLAENFVLLMMQDQEVATPRILDEMRQLLRE